MGSFGDEVTETDRWMQGERFTGLTRAYSARQVVEQRGVIPTDYTVARNAAERFYARLRELFDDRRSITTFGPYSPGQAVAMKRVGISDDEGRKIDLGCAIALGLGHARARKVLVPICGQ